MPRTAKTDPQITELHAKHFLCEEVIKIGLEYASPARDNGIDVVVYNPWDFAAVPVQIKSAQTHSFGLDKKYKKTKHLILAYVWLKTREIYLLTYEQAFRILRASKWHRTDSWKVKDGYATTSPSKKVRDMLDPYRASPARWEKLLAGNE